MLCVRHDTWHTAIGTSEHTTPEKTDSMQMIKVLQLYIACCCSQKQATWQPSTLKSTSEGKKGPEMTDSMQTLKVLRLCTTGWYMPLSDKQAS